MNVYFIFSRCVHRRQRKEIRALKERQLYEETDGNKPDTSKRPTSVFSSNNDPKRKYTSEEHQPLLSDGDEIFDDRRESRSVTFREPVDEDVEKNATYLIARYNKPPTTEPLEAPSEKAKQSVKRLKRIHETSRSIKSPRIKVTAKRTFKKDNKRRNDISGKCYDFKPNVPFSPQCGHDDDVSSDSDISDESDDPDSLRPSHQLGKERRATYLITKFNRPVEESRQLKSPSDKAKQSIKSLRRIHEGITTVSLPQAKQPFLPTRTLLKNLNTRPPSTPQPNEIIDKDLKRFSYTGGFIPTLKMETDSEISTPVLTDVIVSKNIPSYPPPPPPAPPLPERLSDSSPHDDSLFGPNSPRRLYIIDRNNFESSGEEVRAKKKAK